MNARTKLVSLILLSIACLAAILSILVLIYSPNNQPSKLPPSSPPISQAQNLSHPASPDNNPQDLVDEIIDTPQLRLQKLTETVRKETIEESARNIPTSILTMGPVPAYPMNPDTWFKEVANDPRVAKFLKIAKEGTESERQAAIKAIIAMCKEWINEYPDLLEPNKQWRPAAIFPGGGSVFPHLLVQLKADPMVSLKLFAAMHTRTQNAFKKEMKRNNAKYKSDEIILSESEMVIAYASRQFFDILLSDPKALESLSAEQRQLLLGNKQTGKMTMGPDVIRVLKMLEEFINPRATE